AVITALGEQRGGRIEDLLAAGGGRRAPAFLLDLRAGTARGRGLDDGARGTLDPELRRGDRVEGAQRLGQRLRTVDGGTAVGGLLPHPVGEQRRQRRGTGPGARGTTGGSESHRLFSFTVGTRSLLGDQLRDLDRVESGTLAQ